MNLSEDILFWAFRYALGRMTYAVEDVASEIIRNADKLSARTKNLMLKEIEEAINDGRAGHSMDVDSWRRVQNALHPNH